MVLYLFVVILFQTCASTSAQFPDSDTVLTAILLKTLNLETEMFQVKQQLAEILERLGTCAVSTTATSVTQPEVTSCPDGWIWFKGSCYYFSRSEANFTEAKHHCNQKGSHLVHVETEEENTFLKSLMLNTLKVGHVWMGLTDVVNEGIWVLTGTNTTALFFDWCSGEPNNNFDGEGCVHFYSPLVRTERKYCWNDMRCSYTMHYFCEKPRQ